MRGRESFRMALSADSWADVQEPKIAPRMVTYGEAAPNREIFRGKLERSRLSAFS